MQIAPLPQKRFSKYREPLVAVPDLVQNQIESYKQFLETGFGDVLREFTPIDDYSGKKFTLELQSFEIGQPKMSEVEARDRKTTYDAPIRARFKLTNKVLGVTKEQEMFLADMPMMTNRGSFIINGVERVIVAQLIRSYGVFIGAEELKGEVC